jgi:hypothetical protein
LRNLKLAAAGLGSVVAVDDEQDEQTRPRYTFP